MTEREIRRIIAEVCGELDRRARGLIVPSLLGAGLALGGCGDRTTPADSMVPRPDATYMGPDRTRWEASYPDSIYMAPDANTRRDSSLDRLLKQELPPVPPYMAPDVGPPQPDYMAPNLDGGSSSLYAAPALDK